MAQWAEKYPFDYAPRGGTVDELGASYVDEIKRVYDLLNELRENAEGTTEAQPHQLMVSSTGKIYIRSNDNKSWIYLGESAENFGLNSLGFVKKADIGLDASGNVTANVTKMANAAINTDNLSNNQVLVYDQTNNKWVNKKPALIDNATGLIAGSIDGSAKAIGGIYANISNIANNQALVYDSLTAKWVNKKIPIVDSSTGLINGSPSAIANATIAASSVTDNQVLAYDTINNRWVNKSVAMIDPSTGLIAGSINGSAAKIANLPIITTNIQDGEILVYRPSYGGFVNETKAAGIGAKEISFVIDGISLASYSGTATTTVGLICTTSDEPDGTDYTRPPIWLKPVATE